MTKREQLYPEIKRLREVEGLKWREIGQRIGLSIQTVHQYYVDPTSERASKRKRESDARLRQTCPRCGGTMGIPRHGVERCKSCWNAEQRASRTRRIELAAALYNEGKTIREIADALGYGPNSTAPEVSMARKRGLIGYRYAAYTVPSATFDRNPLENQSDPATVGAVRGHGNQERGS